MVQTPLEREKRGLQDPAERDEVAAWAAGLEAMHARIADRFTRPEPRQRALAYVKGRWSPIEHKNGWPLAEPAGEATPDGMQRLLATAQGAADRVRDDLRTYVLEHVADPQAVLVFDETGFLNKGAQSVGVQRPYAGTAGRLEHGPIGVLLAYASPTGRTCIDRELYVPRVWADEAERRQEAGGPEAVTFATTPQLAPGMLARAWTAGVRAPWGTGEAVYGSDPGLRHQREEEPQPSVLAVRSHELTWISAGAQLRPVTVAQVAATIPRGHWPRLSVGDEAKGPRLDEWALKPLVGPVDPAWGRWLWVRRSPSAPVELADDVVWGPVDTPLAEMVRVAGRRWAIEERFETANGEVGLDQYAVRRWRGWYRPITLALLAHA